MPPRSPARGGIAPRPAKRTPRQKKAAAVPKLSEYQLQRAYGTLKSMSFMIFICSIGFTWFSGYMW